MDCKTDGFEQTTQCKVEINMNPLFMKESRVDNSSVFFREHLKLRENFSLGILITQRS